MSSTGSLFSQTLEEITKVKWSELAAKKKAFDKHHNGLLQKINSDPDAVGKLEILSQEVKTIFNISVSKEGIVQSTRNTPLELDLKNLDRFLTQARYDPSVTKQSLARWQSVVLRHVENQSIKYTYASLYAQLTTEWLASNESVSASVQEDEGLEDYEHIAGKTKMESRHAWEEIAFGDASIDEKAIRQMLSELFEATPDESMHLCNAMERLRKETQAFERDLASPESFSVANLRWTISSLADSNLLTDEKRAVLRDFKSNDTVLREIADVLNMRMAALHDWSWGKEVQLEQRRQLNGNFLIFMHEDLLQAIFLHYIGIKFSVFFKQSLGRFRRSKGVWASQTSVSAQERQRRDYFLGPRSNNSTVSAKRKHLYRRYYFLSQLQDTENQTTHADEGEEEAEFHQVQQLGAGAGSRPLQDYQVQSSYTQQPPHQRLSQVQAAPQGAPRVAMRRAAVDAPVYRGPVVLSEENLDLEPEDQSYVNLPRNPMEAKQMLLRLLTTDIAVKARLSGETTCFRSQIDNLYPSLPHATIKTTLAFFGVSPKWLTFFGRFLEAPLRFSDDDSSGIRKRKQGTPGAHSLSTMFGEVVLFCLDFAINQLENHNGETLWRLHEDFWFWSDHSTCVEAWSKITSFSKTMGLRLNKTRSGSARMTRSDGKWDKLISADVGDVLPKGQIRWGMLCLNPERGRFEIDQNMVDEHIRDLRRQLDSKQSSLFTWIQTWNAFASKFFSSNFGYPANCFGQEHVNNMLETHKRIQREIFSPTIESKGTPRRSHDCGSVIEFLQREIESRFGVSGIPEGFFYFPTNLGGLNVQNPFIELLQVRDQVVQRPEKLLDDFKKAEMDAYRAAQKDFDAGNRKMPRRRHWEAEFVPELEQLAKFMSFEEYIKYRETLEYGYKNELSQVYQKLLDRPSEDTIDLNNNSVIKPAIEALNSQPDLDGILGSWYGMSSYWKWVCQFYGPEIIDRFGGLNIVERGLLPMGMISLVRDGKVKWQE